MLSHRATVETVNSAAAELLESSPGDEASHLRAQLDQLNQSWESLLLKTQERQKLLEAALQQVQENEKTDHFLSFSRIKKVSVPCPSVFLQAEGFHGELEEFLQWLRRTESQLSAAKPTGGLPETAREQLQQHEVTETQQLTDPLRLIKDICVICPALLRLHAGQVVTIRHFKPHFLPSLSTGAPGSAGSAIRTVPSPAGSGRVHVDGPWRR